MAEMKGPVRRIRVQYFSYHNPPVWAAYYEPPGMRACLCHALTIEDMWLILREYFATAPLRVDTRRYPNG
jgi:hypothetical protein